MATHEPLASVFVGRRRELDALAAALGDARTGRPRLVLVEGPAGIGKTALVEHFLRDRDDVAVVRASGDESESDLAFGVIDQLTRRVGDGRLTWDDHVEAGAHVLELLGSLQDERPVVLFVDDAHWADTPSLRALLFVVRRLVADRVLVVVTTREDPTALPAGLAKAAERIAVRALEPAELRELARAQGVELSARGLQRLREHTRGNPLYTRAILDELPPDAWHRPGALPAPRSFAAIVRRRLQDCGARDLIDAVAVLGPRCSLALAAELAGTSEPLQALDEAAHAGLLSADDSSGIPAPSFPHPLIAAAVYEQIPLARRAALHARAAALVDDEPVALRHLAAAAAGPDEALARRLEALAADLAASRSLEAAASAMLSASRLSATRSRREQRLLRAVDWLLVAGEAGQARAFATEIAGCEDSPRRSSILGQLAELEGRVDEAAVLFTTAWQQCDTHADPVLAAIIAHRNAYHALRSLRDSDVVVWARRALELAGDDALASGWASTLALSLWRLGEAEQAFAVLEQARTGEEGSDLHARGMRGWLRFAEDEIEPARADLEAAAAGELRHGALLYGSIRLTTLSRLQFVKGEWADAVVSAERALALAEEAEHPHSAFVWWAVLEVPAARGDWETADAYARAAAAEPIDARDRAIAVGLALATVAAAKGDPEAVAEALEPVAALSPNPGADEPGLWPWQDLYAEALVALGRAADAAAFLIPHEALAARRRRASSIARLARVRGRAEAALGRRDEAAAAFARALEHIEPLGMPYEQALIHFARGQFRRRNGRRRAAADDLTLARDAFAALGARPALERCEGELASCGLTPVKRGDGTPRADLTPQEQAVARLVATGSTNREVAAQLLLSVKTVEVHLTRIYAKLGISSRSQLAAENPYRRDGKE